MPKITSIMRRMVNDREFYDAIVELIHATDKLREIESLRRYNPDHPPMPRRPNLVKGG